MKHRYKKHMQERERERVDPKRKSPMRIRKAPFATV